MKTTVGILAVLLATALSARADQPQRDPQERQRVEQRFGEVKDRLALTSEQAEQARPILTGMMEITRAVRRDYVLAEGNPSAQRRHARELRAIRSHADARLKRILTWTQREELREILAEWQDEPESGFVATSKTP